MPREVIPHVKRVTAKGRVYYYFNTGKRDQRGRIVYVPLPGFDDPAFWPKYATLKGGRTKRANVAAEMTVPRLIELYRQSPQWRNDLTPSSQRLYGMGLDTAAKKLSLTPAQALDAAFVRELIDDMAETPSMANAFLRTLGALYSWGRKRGHVTNNPTMDVEQFEGGEHSPWSDDAIAVGKVATDPTVRLAVHMMLFTAQRIGDVSKARWQDLRDGSWRMTPEKTKRKKGEMKIRLHSDLVAELARHAKEGPFIFTGAKGPIRPATLRARIQAYMSEHGHKIVPHGLRKNAVIELLASECSVAETAAISGQSLQMVEHYAKQRNQAELGSAAILKWERKA